MPKKGRSKKDERGGGGRKSGRGGDVAESVTGAPTEDDYTECGRSIETMSIMSNVSDTRTEGSEEQGDVDESSAQDVLEDKLLECIEGITQKSAKGRVDCLKSLRAAMSKKLLTDFLSTRKIEIADGLSRSVLKGKQDEQCSASLCSVLLMLQLGSDSTSAIQEIYDMMMQPLRTVLNDNSAHTLARAACAEAAGLLCFLSDQEIQVTVELMNVMEDIFKMSYHKGDGSTRVLTQDITTLHCSALSAWTLLLTIVPQSTTDKIIHTHMSKLAELLTSSDMELRIVAGEAMALLYELARDADEEFEPEGHLEICTTLKSLATESNKFRAKKDRKQQRSSFRDILSFVEQDMFTTDNIKISPYERLSLSCWSVRARYGALCHVLSSGMNRHLQDNEYVREVFELGPPITPGLGGGRVSKEDRHFQHGQAFRLRTRSRNKQRDRKSAAASAYD